ncbi:MAG: transcriptional repressor [Clostridiaceae bacterium]|jgi:Fur family ferric uptake transcriptional regulator|nr:transcriptional repressor [Clostridiaceae bacterium]
MEIAEIFREKNLKKTTPRVAIVGILLCASHPLSENDIKDKMGYMYDRSTFYRTIQTLIDVKIIHRIVVDNTNVRYAINNLDYDEVEHPKSHAHFYCRKCENVICMDNIQISNCSLPPNYEMDECEILIKGICENCRSISV